MRILLTGADGFTGRHLIPRLQDQGATVFALGREAVPDLVCLEADLSERTRIADWLATVQPTHVIHLAALSHVVGDPLSFYRVNVVGTETLLHAIDDAGLHIEGMIAASTANLYGNESVGPLREDSPIHPANHYGLSKAAMELLLRQWSTKIRTVIVRPFNYTGPGQSERFVFAKIAAAFHRGDRELILGNVDIERDVGDVRDVAMAYASLILNRDATGTVNICTGQTRSLKQAIDLLSEVYGYRPAVKVDPALVRPNDIKSLVGSPARLESLIGRRNLTPFEQTLTDMAAG